MQGLRIRPNATKQEIKIAHKKMLMKYHPDHGGSTEMASKINQARDVLLGKDCSLCRTNSPFHREALTTSASGSRLGMKTRPHAY